MELNPPKAVRDATARYRSDMDTVTQFVEECCEDDPAGAVGIPDLYEAYETFCFEYVLQPIKKSSLLSRLKELGYENGRTASERYISGLKLVSNG